MPSDLNKFNKNKKGKLKELLKKIDTIQNDINEVREQAPSFGVRNYIVVNGLFLGALLLSSYYQITFIYLIITGIIWLMMFLSLIVLSDKAIILMGDIFRDPTVPRWIDISYDLIICIILAASGSIFTAFAYLIHLFLVDYGYKKFYENVILIEDSVLDAKQEVVQALKNMEPEPNLKKGENYEEV